MGTPAYDAGFGEGDVLVVVGGKDVQAAGDVAAIVEAAKPGDRLEVDVSCGTASRARRRLPCAAIRRGRW